MSNDNHENGLVLSKAEVKILDEVINSQMSFTDLRDAYSEDGKYWTADQINELMNKIGGSL